MATGAEVTPAALAWLFGEQEVVGTGRHNVRVPAGVEVDELVLARTVVVRALWGLAGRALVQVAAVEQPQVRQRRFLGMSVRTGDPTPVVRVLPLGDMREPTVEGVLLGLLHGRLHVGRVSRALAGLPDITDLAPAPDRTDLGAVLASGPPAGAWLTVCRREVEGVDRDAIEPAYRAGIEQWDAFRVSQRGLLDAVTLAVGEGIRAATVPDGV